MSQRQIEFKKSIYLFRRVFFLFDSARRKRKKSRRNFKYYKKNPVSSRAIKQEKNRDQRNRVKTGVNHIHQS